MLRTMLSVTLTVLRGVSTRCSICIGYDNKILRPSEIPIQIKEKRVLNLDFGFPGPTIEHGSQVTAGAVWLARSVHCWYIVSH